MNRDYSDNSTVEVGLNNETDYISTNRNKLGTKITTKTRKQK